MARTDDEAWPQHAHDARNTRWVGRRRRGYDRQPEFAFDLPDAESPPVVSGGVVTYTGHNGQVSARDLATGQSIWESWLSVPPSSMEEPCAPAIVGDLLWVAVDGALSALDLHSGAERWQLDGRRLSDSAVLGADAPTIVGRTVYLRGREGWFYAVDARRGTIRWHRRVAPDEFEFVVHGSAVADGTALVGCSGGLVVALDAATGQRRWPAVTGLELDLPPCTTGRLVVAVSGDRVFGLDLPTGERRWRRRLDEPIFGGLACTDSRVVVSGRSSAHALSLDDGRVQWRSRLAGGLGAPSIAGDVVIVPGEHPHRLHGIDLAGGARLWTVRLSDPPKSELVVAGDRLLVTSGGAVKVFAFAR